MLHESNNEILTVRDCSENFDTIFEKEYFPQKLVDEIKEANVLLIPNYVKRENVCMQMALDSLATVRQSRSTA